MTENELQGTPSFLYKDKVLPLTQVLDDLYQITFFRFIRVHSEWGTTSLGNSLNFALRYWNEYVDVDTTLWPQFIHPKVNVRIYDGIRTSISKKEKRMFEERLKKYQLSDQGIVIIRHSEQYLDTFNFSSIKYEQNALNKLLQNLPDLQNYCDFFLQEVETILKDPKNYQKLPASSQHSVALLSAKDILKPLSPRKSVYDNAYTNQFIREKLSPLKNVRLTPAEAQSLYWLIKGKTAEETALILKRSRRTIEGHLASIRTKLGCYKSSSLIVKAEQLGLIQGDRVLTEPNL